MRASLLQDGVELKERDFFADPFTEAELRELIGERGPADFFSWNSPSFRKTGLARADMTDERMIEMILEEPRLLRRPLLKLSGSHLVVGTDREAVARVLGGKKP